MIFRQGPDGGREERGELVELDESLELSQNDDGQPRIGSGSGSSSGLARANGGQMQTAVIPIDAATIIAAVPFDLIEAQGANAVIVPVSVSTWFEPGATAFDSTPNLDIGWLQDSTIERAFRGGEPDLTSDKKQLTFWEQDNNGVAELTTVTGKALSCQNNSDPVPTVGDGTLYFIVTFFVMYLTNVPVFVDGYTDGPITTRVPISAAAVKADADIQLLPAPGEGKIIIPVTVATYAVPRKGAVAFDATRDSHMTYANAIDSVVMKDNLQLDANPVLIISNPEDWHAFSEDTEDPRNQALVLRDSYPLGFTTGDATVDFVLSYVVFDTVTKALVSGAGSGMRLAIKTLDQSTLRGMGANSFRDVLGSPAADEILLPHFISAQSRQGANPYGYTGYWTITWGNSEINGYAAYFYAIRTVEAFGWGVFDYENPASVPDIQGAPLIVSAGDMDISPAGDGFATVWVWYSVLK